MRKQKKRHFTLVEILIVIGIIAYAWIVVPLGSYSMLAGSVALAGIMLPLIVRSTEETLNMLPSPLKEAGLARAAPYRSVVMRMLEREISERQLRIGLQRYLRRWSYSNADWDDLIKLLETTTGKDLQAWNEIWIKESGAPVIEFQKNGIAMIDESGKKRVWPQVISVCWNYMGLKQGTLVPLRDTLTPFRHGESVVLPDGEVLGYGCFLPTEYSIRFLDEELGKIGNPLYRAVGWQLLYEGVLNKKVKGEFFVKLCIKHLPAEKYNRIVNRTLSFLRSL